MGVAVIIPGIKFNPDYHGKVTPVGNTPPKSLTIVAESSYTAAQAQLVVKYQPLNTTLRGVTWSIVSGGEYASIDSNGLLTINRNASSASVTVKATSSADASVFATKAITVTWQNPVTVLTKVSCKGNPTINTGIRLSDGYDSIEMKYKITAAPAANGTLWGTINEHSSAYINSALLYTVVLVGCDASSGATTGELHTYRDQMSIGTIYTDSFAIGSLERNGTEVTKYGQQIVGTGFTISDDIHILHPSASLSFEGIDIYYFKFKRNGVTTYDFKAAVKDGVYGFYDENSDTFITNTGNSGSITQ